MHRLPAQKPNRAKRTRQTVNPALRESLDDLKALLKTLEMAFAGVKNIEISIDTTLIDIVENNPSAQETALAEKSNKRLKRSVSQENPPQANDSTQLPSEIKPLVHQTTTHLNKIYKFLHPALSQHLNRSQTDQAKAHAAHPATRTLPEIIHGLCQKAKNLTQAIQQLNNEIYAKALVEPDEKMDVVTSNQTEPLKELLTTLQTLSTTIDGNSEMLTNHLRKATQSTLVLLPKEDAVVKRPKTRMRRIILNPPALVTLTIPTDAPQFDPQRYRSNPSISKMVSDLALDDVTAIQKQLDPIEISLLLQCIQANPNRLLTKYRAVQILERLKSKPEYVNAIFSGIRE